MNFYDEILQAVYDCIFTDLVETENVAGVDYPIKQDDDDPVKVRINSTDGRFATPLWQVLLRPVRTADVEGNNLIPSVFIRVSQGQRSASGRVGQDGRVRAVVGDITEEYQIGIQGVFRDGFGEGDTSIPKWDITLDARQQERDPLTVGDITLQGVQGNPTVTEVTGSGRDWTLTLSQAVDALPASSITIANNSVNSSRPAQAKPLSNQVNGFVNDLDKCLTPPAIRAKVTDPRVEIRDAYITEWVAQDAYDGSTDQIVTAVFSVIINWRRPYVG